MQHSAASTGRRPVVELLLERGASPDARSHGGFTALHSAAQNGDATLVEMLVARGADPARLTDAGIAASDLARTADHDMIAERLAGDVRDRRAPRRSGGAAARAT